MDQHATKVNRDGVDRVSLSRLEVPVSMNTQEACSKCQPASSILPRASVAPSTWVVLDTPPEPMRGCCSHRESRRGS